MDYNPNGGYRPPDNRSFYTESYYPNGQYPLPPGKKFPPFIPHEVWHREKANLRRYSMMAGCAILLYIVLSSVYVGLFQGVRFLIQNFFTSFYPTFAATVSSAEFEYLYETIYSVLIVGGPFFLIGWWAKKKGYSGAVPMGKPRHASLMPLIIPAAFGLCLLGNIVTAYLDTFFEMLTGIALRMPETAPTPHSFVGISLYFLSTAVVPALVEEMALRGIIMQPLRRYGDWFAILCSALIFGLMHCNLMQIPFAFLAGVVIGYAVIVTDSIWTGVIIHFLNNAFSVAVSIVSEFYGVESKEYMVCDVLFYVLIAIGVVCAFFYFRKAKQIRMQKSPLLNTGRDFIGQPHPYSARVSYGTLFKTYVLTVPMFAAFAAVIYETIMAVLLLAG